MSYIKRQKANIGGLFSTLGTLANYLPNSFDSTYNDANQGMIFNEGVDGKQFSGFTARRNRLKYGGRPKAFWGMLASGVLSTVGNIVGSAISAKTQREQNKALVEREMENNRKQIALANDKNVQQSMQNLAEANNMYQEEDDNLIYSRGGKVRRRLRNPFEITDGGVALPIGQSTFLLRGSSHQDVNETGQTGIGINFGGKEIEAEGGEVAQKKGDDLRIFSAQPMLNGVSPAEAVLAGANKDKVFNAQERRKIARKRDDMLACGGRIRPKAVWGTFINADGETETRWIDTGDDTFGLNSVGHYNSVIPETINDIKPAYKNDYDDNIPSGLRPGVAYGINTGLDFLGSLGSALINNRTLKDIDKLYDPSNFKFGTPVDEVYIPASTKVYTGARQSQLNNSRLRGMTNVARNTASSNVANARMQDINSQYTDKVNQLWEDASNQNLQMRRANVERAQQVAARNASRRSEFSLQQAKMYNDLAMKRIENKANRGNNWASLIASAASSAANGIQNYMDYQTNGANIAMAALPYLGNNANRQRTWDSLRRTYGVLPYIRFS